MLYSDPWLMMKLASERQVDILRLASEPRSTRVYDLRLALLRRSLGGALVRAGIRVAGPSLPSPAEAISTPS